MTSLPNTAENLLVMLVEYDGSAFHGSQRQDNSHSVQEAIEAGFTQLNIPHSAVTFSGRTDTGVHAKGQVAHTRLPLGALSNIPNLCSALNAVLPPSIAIIDSVMTDDFDFHSVKSAQWRWYQYRIFNHPTRSIWKPDATWIQTPLNIEAMAQAAQQFEGEHDFTSFHKSKEEAVNPICIIRHCRIHQEVNDIVLNLLGNRFLYNMVRIMMGTLIEIGLEKRFQPDEISSLLAAKNRLLAGETAKAEGLSLMAVHYPAPWDFFKNHVYGKQLERLIQESSKNVENLLRKAS